MDSGNLEMHARVLMMIPGDDDFQSETQTVHAVCVNTNRGHCHPTNYRIIP